MAAAVNFNVRIVSYSMHGFMQGLPVVEDLIASDNKPDFFLLQEYWVTLANLDKFDNYFPGYFSFCCSAWEFSSDVDNSLDGTLTYHDGAA